MKLLITILFSIFFLLFLSPIPAAAQISDSLYNALPARIKPVHQDVLTASEKRAILSNAGDLVPAPYYGELKELAGKFSEETNRIPDRETKVLNSVAIADFYYIVPAGSLAFENYLNALHYLDGKDDPKMLNYLYRKIGSIYAYEGKLDSAMYYIHNASDLSIKLKDTVGQKEVYEIYALIYYYLQSYEKSIYYVKQLLSMSGSREKWNMGYTRNYLDISAMYGRLYNITRENRFADSSLKIVKTVMNQHRPDSLNWFGSCYTFLGVLYFYEGNYYKSLSCLDSSLLEKYRLNDKYFHDPQGKLLFRALCLIKTGRYDSGKKILDSIKYQLDFFDLKQVNQVLFEYAESIGDWKNAFIYHENFVRYSDSLAIIEKQGAVFNSEEKYLVEKLENKNLKEKESSAKVLIIALIVIAAMLLLILLLFAAFKRQQIKRINEQRLTEFNKKMAVHSERIRISQELHDDLGTGLTSIRLLSKRVMKQPENPDAAALSKIDRISGEMIDQMSDIIWLMNHMEDTINGLLSYLRAYMADYLFQAGIDTKLDFKNNIRHDFQINSEQRRNILLVLKEAFNNAVKYADARLFSIQCNEDGNDMVMVVKDNGKGLPESIPLNSNGLNNIKKRIRALGGTAQFTSENGCCITIRIPKQASDKML